MSRLHAFHRRGDGIEREFTDREQEALEELCGSLGAVLQEANPADPAVRRLLPDAVPTDPEAQAEFDDAVRERLQTGKVERAVLLVGDLEAGTSTRGGVRVTLDRGAAVRWLQTLGDLRLLLAERYGIEQLRDGAGGVAVTYAWLTWLQGELVATLPPVAAAR